MDATLQSVDLRTLAHATEHDGAADMHIASERRDFQVDLDSEFARWREDECRDLLPAEFGWIVGNVLQQRQHECCRLAGAGFSETEEVAAFKLWRHRLHLNRCRRFVPDLAQGT